MAILRRSLTLVATVATAACSDATSTAPTDEPAPGYSVAAEQAVGPSLVQRVRLSTNQPARGDTLVIRSVLVNQGTAPATVTHAICNLHYAPNDVLENPYATCAGFSATRSLAPGDSVSHEDRRVVIGRPGQHTVRLAHLLNPKVEVPVALTVR